jgi:hypothetical protein
MYEKCDLIGQLNDVNVNQLEIFFDLIGQFNGLIVKELTNEKFSVI